MARLLLAALLLALLLAGADRLAANQAEAALASRAKAEFGTTETPQVNIRGFPFLTQFAAGRYDGVDLSADAVAREDVRLSRVSVRLRGLEIPPGDVFGTIESVPADTAEADVLLSYDDLTAFVRGRGLSVTAADAGHVRVTGAVEVVGRRLQASAISTVAIRDGNVVISAQRYEVGNGIADRLVTAAIGGRFDITVALDDLPFGAKLTGLRVRPDGVHVSAAARDVVLR